VSVDGRRCLIRQSAFTTRASSPGVHGFAPTMADSFPPRIESRIPLGGNPTPNAAGRALLWTRRTARAVWLAATQTITRELIFMGQG